MINSFIEFYFSGIEVRLGLAIEEIFECERRSVLVLGAWMMGVCFYNYEQ